MSKFKSKSDKRKFIISTAVIVLINLILIISGIVLAAYLYYKNGMSPIIKIIPYIITGISSFAGGHIFRKKHKRRGITDGFVYGAVLSLITVPLLIMINGFNFSLYSLIILTVIILFSVFGGIEQANIKS